MNTIPNQEVRRNLGFGLIEYEFDPVRLQVTIAQQAFSSLAARLKQPGDKTVDQVGALNQAKAEASGERDQKSTSK